MRNTNSKIYLDYLAYIIDNLIKIYRWDDTNQQIYSIVKKYNNNYIEISGKISKNFNLEDIKGVITITLPFSISTHGAFASGSIIYHKSHRDHSIALEASIESGNKIIFYSIDQTTYPNGIGAHLYFNISAFLS